MYDKVSTNLNFVEREKNIEKFWEDHQIFEKASTAVKRAKPTHSMTAPHGQRKTPYRPCADACH